MNKFIEINYEEFKRLRFHQWLKQGRICPILKQEIKLEDSVFDHKHRKKSESIGIDGKGLLRGVIHRQANSLEGKITNAFIRYGLHKFNISLPDLLRNIAAYIESPPMKPKYIHPNERTFKKLAKKDYNKIKKHYFKMYPKRKKMPMYPASGKMTKEFEILLKRVNEYVKK